jgi:hypothetical protein
MKAHASEHRMARARGESNGKLDKLDEAMAALVQAQALLVQNQAAFQSQIIDLQRLNAERFARIEAILLDHSRILAEHRRLLQALPDAVREKTGFKAS